MMKKGKKTEDRAQREERADRQKRKVEGAERDMGIVQVNGVMIIHARL